MHDERLLERRNGVLVGLTIVNDWMVQQDDDRRTTENAAPQADRWCKAP